MITQAESRLQAAHALLDAQRDGMFADYALHFLRLALPDMPQIRPVIATLEVCIAKGDVSEAVAQLAPFLPQPLQAEAA